MTGPVLRLYNTLTRRKEALRPFDSENVRMYVCGPTVYDYAHIGNARPAIVFDVLFRLLRHVYGERHVTYVRNITDVDDKINARALRDYPGLPLNEAIRKVTEKTGDQYHKDVAALGCLPPDHEPRATDNIAQMRELVQKLLDQGHAYVARGEEGLEVLFDTVSMPDYGGLSRRILDEQQAGARIAEKDHKRNPGDFVLWKESEADQPGWEGAFAISKANRKALKLNDDRLIIHGRPGWHLECSAMSERYLWTEIEQKLSGEACAHPHQFDIHGGGLDLIFPHHENEIAQSRCAFETPTMAQIWMHNGFLQVEGQKMSKSLGNFVTIHELLEDWEGYGWPGEAVRFNMLRTHYRQPIDWTYEGLDEAHSILWEWYGETEKVQPTDVPEPFVAALSDDLNTPAAIAELHAMKRNGDIQRMRAALQLLGFGGERVRIPRVRKVRTGDTLMVKVTDEITKALIATRLTALAAKDFATADAIRADLLTKGIQLMDYKDPETGERRTKWEIKR